jgi:hypothetical protein
MCSTRENSGLVLLFICSFCLHRMAHLLASSFNFQGRVKKTFYVLTDDKVGSGPRLRPGTLSQGPPVEEVQPMETEQSEQTEQSGQSTSSNTSRKMPSKGNRTPTLASKLAAQAVKRKASDPPASSVSKQRLKQ